MNGLTGNIQAALSTCHGQLTIKAGHHSRRLFQGLYQAAVIVRNSKPGQSMPELPAGKDKCTNPVPLAIAIALN